jgi:putative flippase GtrA
LLGMWKSGPPYGPTVLVYSFVAVASALTEWLSFFIAARVIAPSAAALAAFFVATAFNYQLSRSIAFLSKRPPGQEMLLLYCVSAVAFLFNFATFILCLKFLDFAPMTAKVIGTGAGFVMNYAFRQFVVFSREPRFPSWASLARLPKSAAARSVDPQFTGGTPEQ